MQIFKGITATAIIILSVFMLVVYTACNKPEYTPSPDPCSGVVCQNNGKCIMGTCDCTAGYTGQYCEKKANAPYLGKWKVTQELVSSNGQPVSGVVKTYEMSVSEDPSGVTMLNVNGIMGEPGYNVLCRIGMTLDVIKDENGNYYETEVQAPSSDFLFKRYQPLGQSNMQLLKGEGSINSLGTQLNGEFYIIYADTARGPVEDRMKFSATFIN